MGLNYRISQERKTLPKELFQDYFYQIEKYYNSLVLMKKITEVYSETIKLLLWANLPWKDDNKFPPLKEKFDYYLILCQNAKKFPNNMSIVESFLDISESMVEEIDDTRQLESMYNDAVNFSKKYHDDFGDIIYNCNEILCKLYRKFNEKEMKDR
ncbi:MAG: hypothetical protein LBF83_08265 [Spirochaetaceae bacterium]|jgi:hypothetical protein|nr:hypothetical protein [Spirochaetaceae bacterium]